MNFEKGKHLGYAAGIGHGGVPHVVQVEYTVTARTVSFSERLEAFGYHSRLDRTTYDERHLRLRVGETPREAIQGAIREREAEIRTRAITAKTEEQRLDREIEALKAKLRSDL
jgi:hypothetical protein